MNFRTRCYAAHILNDFINPRISQARFSSTQKPIKESICFRGAVDSGEFEVVLADLGSAMLACPGERVPWKLEPSEVAVPVCTLNYRPPDILLGCQRFGSDLDMWSFGCLAAELHLRRALFPVSGGGQPGSDERSVLEAQLQLLGTPESNSSAFLWLESLPLVGKLYQLKGAQRIPRKEKPAWPPQCLQGCPRWLTQVVRETLKLEPRARASAASALLRSFLGSPCLSVTLRAQAGKRGVGSIAEGALQPEVLEYIQGCAAWPELVEQCRQTNFEPNRCISPGESKLRMKREFVAFTDVDQPPVCKRLNGDDLSHLSSERLRCFVAALRRRARSWLNQLTERVRAEVERQALPKAFLKTNGHVFMEEDFADNAFAYASVQVMRAGKRAEEWHTDGGASLLHGGLTIFGSRVVEVRTEGRDDCISLVQRPGSFYIGNFTALEHRVVHRERSEGSFGEGPPSEQIEIAVMLRSDVFREARARVINSTPGPAETFHLVNREVARHIAERQFYLPDLGDVIAESKTLGCISPQLLSEGAAASSS